ncbi:MAG TPA: AAA family ATPase [Puia sp.]|nr:AAA family ATPase [Puia sp.]
MAEPVYFLNLEIENFRCFKIRQKLDLSDGKGNWKKWTVILGDNGTGKSSLLELLATSEIEEHISKDNKDNVFGPIAKISGSTKATFPLNNSSIGFCDIGLNIYWVHGRQGGEFSDLISISFSQNYPFRVNIYNDKRLKKLLCFGYGANRKMGTGSLSKLMDNNSETLFDDNARLINAEEWLLQLDYAASKESDVRSFAINKRNQVKEILIDLLPDINDIRFSTPTKENLNSFVEFQTPFGWVNIQQLSLGYKTMVAWMVDLAARMFERYPDSDNPLAEPAIVLVDEIDLHLHPKWQRKIFDYLSDKFPQTQFIVTAHSPLVVQSAPIDANIVLLRKEGDHVVIDNELASVQNWRLDQILTSDLFGVDSARGNEAERKLEERKRLLGQKNLTKEEEKRLEELNSFTNKLPTAYNMEDMEAMSLVREAAEYLKNQKK